METKPRDWIKCGGSTLGSLSLRWRNSFLGPQLHHQLPANKSSAHVSERQKAVCFQTYAKWFGQMKPTLWESVLHYENVCLEDYSGHTSGNLLHKIYIIFKTEHMGQDNRGHKKWQMRHWSWTMWLRYIFSKCKGVKWKKMKVHLRRVATWYSFISKAWLELNLLTNIKFIYWMDYFKPYVMVIC